MPLVKAPGSVGCFDKALMDRREIELFRVAGIPALAAFQQPTHLLRCHVAMLFPEMQVEPQLEARVRHGTSNTTPVSKADRLGQPRMWLRRLDVKDTPDLIVCLVAVLSLLRCASLVLNRRLHQLIRFPVTCSDLDRDRAGTKFTLQALDIPALRS